MMNIIYLPTSDLVPYGRNAKKHPAEQVRLIANSIKEFGFKQPIVVDKDNVVVIGHGRLLAAVQMQRRKRTKRLTFLMHCNYSMTKTVRFPLQGLMLRREQSTI